MKKDAKPDVWDITDENEKSSLPAAMAPEADTPKAVKAAAPTATKNTTPISLEFDLDGLMTDFPTATELQKFVYDRTGVVLDVKGRANKLKYQIAMDVLNGAEAPAEFTGTQNPYLDRNELIPEEELKVVPAPPADVQGVAEVTRYVSNSFPHPDTEWQAQDIKATVIFRKYANDIITYEIIGPIGKKAVGERINKFGVKQPERIVWIDPRTGEQVIRRENGQLTPLGTRLQAHMKRQKVNKTNAWDLWIDREFVMGDGFINDNPWAST